MLTRSTAKACHPPVHREPTRRQARAPVHALQRTLREARKYLPRASARRGEGSITGRRLHGTDRRIHGTGGRNTGEKALGRRILRQEQGPRSRARRPYGRAQASRSPAREFDRPARGPRSPAQRLYSPVRRPRRAEQRPRRAGRIACGAERPGRRAEREPCGAELNSCAAEEVPCPATCMLTRSTAKACNAQTKRPSPTRFSDRGAVANLSRAP